jgi:hypothetical protein
MKLDRNINGTGRGKYGLIKTRRLEELRGTRAGLLAEAAIAVLQETGVIEWGEPGTEGEFFVIKLRDQHAFPALASYAVAAGADDMDLAHDVYELSKRAGVHSPFCKKPD